MSKDLKRRIEKLERQVGVAGFETKLRALVCRLGGNQKAYRRAARGYERELGRALGEEGTITWEGFLLLRDLLHGAPEGSIAWRQWTSSEPEAAGRTPEAAQRTGTFLRQPEESE